MNIFATSKQSADSARLTSREEGRLKNRWRKYGFDCKLMEFMKYLKYIEANLTSNFFCWLKG